MRYPRSTCNITFAKLSPGDTLSSFGISIAQRELIQISNGGPRNQLSFYRGTVDQQAQLLEITMRLMKLLDSNELLRKVCQPTLWHPTSIWETFLSPPTSLQKLFPSSTCSRLPCFPRFSRPSGQYSSNHHRATIM